MSDISMDVEVLGSKENPSQPQDVQVVDPSGQLAGYRLHRLEVYNWGTFDKHVWTLHLDGRNTLLTGEIGSGKSTLVDAITTLLVPSRQITYNKAAGAEGRERNLLSYVRGNYKIGVGESEGTTRPETLRAKDTYTVLLAVFHNEGYDSTVTLAQVHWPTKSNEISHIYVVAERDLSIAEHFSGFDSSFKTLRNRLRKAGAELPSSFQDFSHRFHQLFGITRKNAMLLFNQTVSMKSVGNLTEFVRTHMLEPDEVETRIQAFIEHFDNLNRAHECVLRAKDQISRLTPLISLCDQYQSVLTQIQRWETCRSGLEPYFANVRMRLLDVDISSLEGSIGLRDLELKKLSREQQEADELCRSLKRAVEENGGREIEELNSRIERKQKESDERRRKYEHYSSLVSALDVPPAQTAATFLEQQAAFSRIHDETAQVRVDLDNKTIELKVGGKKYEDQEKSLDRELTSLKARQSNIDTYLIELRRDLCQWLQLPEEILPFAGELIRIPESEQEWEDAAERVLHGFGLSLLVPDRYYRDVADWVNKTNLGRRLVYYRVREPGRYDHITLHPDSLVHKLEVKPDTALRSWLQNELARRFDYACCESVDDFVREERAITRAGQIKEKSGKHEKDDRHRGRTNYVLGWTNLAKIRALEEERKDCIAKIEGIIKQMLPLQEEQAKLNKKLNSLSRLEEHSDFSAMDWWSSDVELETMRADLKKLEDASDQLNELRKQSQAAREAYDKLNLKYNSVWKAQVQEEERLKGQRELRESIRSIYDESQLVLTEEIVGCIQVLQNEKQGEEKTTLKSAERDERVLREYIQCLMDSERRKHKSLNEKICIQMTEYKDRYWQETQEVDVSPEAAEDYRRMLLKLQHDDLPRFDEAFKRELNTNTINEVVSFHNHLNREADVIKERIEVINSSLLGIDYNPSRYIQLDLQVNIDQEILQFKQDLRACTTGALDGTDNDQYSEEKFLQVKSLIERLRGRKDYTEIDRRWKEKVTDVRQWFSFAAIERWREDGTVHEHYPDSGGKSGGQKEKLAYTVLAASLAYQFGIECDGRRSRSFHFTVIDEAFGRGSDESTRYGLELFKKLNLQLMIITPMQKIHVIEPYIASVGLVHNKDGRNSTLRNISIEELQVEKEKYLAGKQ